MDIGRLKELDAVTEGRIRDKKLVGAAYAVAYRNEIVFRNAFGYADREKKTPMRADTVVRLASMTKPITGAAVMMLAEQGKISPDDCVGRYIPSFAHMEVAETDENGRITGWHPAQNEIRIRDLLNHSSGLGSGPVGDLAWKAYGMREGDTIASRVPEFGAQLLDFEPRTKLAYSWTQAFDVAAYIVEQVSGLDIETFVLQNILHPLGCFDTVYTPSSAQWARMMKMYGTADGEVREIDMQGRIFGGVPLSYHAAGAGMAGTLDDYMRFAGMLYNGGTWNGVRILKEESVDRMAVPSVGRLFEPGRDAETWGLSMRVIHRQTPAQPLLPGTFGWSGAYGTHFFIDRRSGVYAVYVTNLENAGGAGAETAREFERIIVSAL